MADLQEYEVEINGQKAVMMLSEEDARRYGVLGDDGNPEDPDSSLVTSSTAKDVANKARTPSNKAKDAE